MTSKHEQIYQKWVETRLTVEPGKDLANRVLARIEDCEKKQSDGMRMPKIIFDYWLENRFVRIGLAFGLTFLGFFRLACVSSLLVP